MVALRAVIVLALAAPSASFSPLLGGGHLAHAPSPALRGSPSLCRPIPGLASPPPRSSLSALGMGPKPPSGPPPGASKAEQADLDFALWDAAKNGETDEVESLIKEGASPNFYDPELLQCTALQWAANNGHADTCKKLVDMGAAVMPTNQFGWTAMHHAANWGYVDCVKTLLEAGADPNAMSESGKTPAQCAAFKGYAAVVEVIRGAAGNADGLITAGSDDIAGFEQQVFRKEGTDYSQWREEWEKPAKGQD